MKKFIFLQGACITLCICACAALGSCSTPDSAAAALMLGGSSQAPVFLGCRAVSNDEVEFEFSQPVKVTSLNFEPALKVLSVEDGSTVKVRLDESPQPGTLLTADLLAEDSGKNTVNVLVPFRSRNDRMPQLVINELRADYSNSNSRIRVEFIEFKTKTAGNLGAMRVFFAGSSQKPEMYEFAPVETGSGEYIVLHLRKMEEACKDEYTSNLAESGGYPSSPEGRDFWFPGVDKLINKIAGYVYVLDQDDNVLAAVMHSEAPASWWTKDYLAQTAEFLHQKGAWTAADGGVCRPADAISTAGITATRTACRDETAENTNTAANWYIVNTSGDTPGKKNNTERYTPKN
ncbi:MAG: hypothetical protein FWC19_02670 [Treponema sp.]|nr:hypothetical protein [Treponema sp.]